MIRALIVDDEALVRERVRTLLQDYTTRIQLIGECADGVEAVQAVRRERPDLLFLDVRMPGIDGFGVLAHLPPRLRPAVVFITAYDEYAIRAFDVGAADYVLKPIQPERFALAIARVLDRAGSAPAPAAELSAVLRDGRAPGHSLERFVVERRGRVEVLPAAQVRWLESVGNYVRLHVTDGTSPVIRTTLRALCDQLAPDRFVRIHRGTILQINFIRAISPRGHGDALITLDDGTTLTASRGRAAELRKRLQNQR